MDDLINSLRSKYSCGEIKIPIDQKSCIPAAVLIPLIKINSAWNILFTTRTDNVASHQGEVSFPGGSYENGDNSLQDTSLRETFEEIGIEKERIEIVGCIEPIKTLSNFIVYPFIGVIESINSLKINYLEVQRVFYIPITWLSNKNNYYFSDHIIGTSHVINVIHYRDYYGENLWGLTARITQQVLGISQ